MRGLTPNPDLRLTNGRTHVRRKRAATAVEPALSTHCRKEWLPASRRHDFTLVSAHSTRLPCVDTSRFYSRPIIAVPAARRRTREDLT
jgi:hypothetical protein